MGQLRRSLDHYLPWRRSALGRTEIVVATPGDLLEAAFWNERLAPRLMVPPSMLRMYGGWIYDATHPFVRGLRDGGAALARFYEDVRPVSAADHYVLPGGEKVPSWELPWTGRHERKPPKGEKGLGPDQGCAYFGPVSDAKLDLEMVRLEKTTASIARHGYKPDLYGDIDGYVVTDGEAAAFLVVGGKHRAAALSHLGAEQVPVTFRARPVRIVDARLAAFWPLVRDGSVPLDVAQGMLVRHVEGRRFEP